MFDNDKIIVRDKYKYLIDMKSLEDSRSYKKYMYKEKFDL